MPEWKGQSRGNKLGYKIFVAICRSIGLGPAYLVLRFVALYYFLFSWKTSAGLYSYFRQRHGYSVIRSVLNIYTNYYRFGQILLDRFVIMSAIDNNFTYHFDGEENLLGIVGQRKGGILLSGHIGNWEVAGHFLQRLNTTVHVVMFDGEHQKIKEYVEEVTGGRKFNVIPVKDDLSHVYAIGEALQKNELVCMHADRYVDTTKTKAFDFMGQPALFPMGPFMLAAIFDVPVSIVFAFKETPTHYHFYGSHPLRRKENEPKQEYIARLMTLFIRQMETMIKMYPEQWFNYYNFWTTPTKT